MNNNSHKIYVCAQSKSMPNSNDSLDIVIKAKLICFSHHILLQIIHRNYLKDRCIFSEDLLTCITLRPYIMWCYSRFRRNKFVLPPSSYHRL